MSTGDVFLSVPSQPPMKPPESPTKRMLTPLVEDDEQDENEAASGGYSHPEFNFNIDDHKQTFLTETGDQTYSNKNNGDVFETESEFDNIDGRTDVSHAASDRLNSYGEMYDDMLSDSESEHEEANDEDYETDLEVDEEKWLYPERFELDLTGEAKYVKVCEGMGISPTTYFIKHIQDRELKMKFHGLGPMRMKALAVPLQTNTNIEILNLEGNAIDEDGAICLTKVLKENFFITELVLAENKLGTEGGKAIGEMLINNRNLYKIDLTGNEIGDGAAPMLCEAVMNNKFLKILLLGTNSFEDGSAKQFQAAISDNATLEVLDLSWNHFKTRGAIMLAEAIQENVGLKSFNMAMAGLGREGAEAMSKALRENRTLLELDISLNRINMEGAELLAKGLRENDTLQIFKCGSNPFDSAGAMVLLEAVDGNEASEIKLLDFSNIMVTMNFAKLQVKLLEERDIKVINEGIIPEFARMNSARLTAFRLDPVGALKMAAMNANVDLAQLLGSFVDQDHSIAPHEFKSQIKTTSMDLIEEQLDFVTKKLTLGGRVQCHSLFDVSEIVLDLNDEPVATPRRSSPVSDRSERAELVKQKTKTLGRNAIG